LAHRTADVAERNENAEIIGAGGINFPSYAKRHHSSSDFSAVSFDLILVYSAIQFCPLTELLPNHLVVCQFTSYMVLYPLVVAAEMLRPFVENSDKEIYHGQVRNLR
jgi:hypothetical protein